MLSNENEKKQFKVYFFVVALVIAFGLGVLTEKKSAVLSGKKTGKETAGSSKLAINDLGLLEDIWEILGEKYAGEIPNKNEAVRGAARGLVESLDDPYTVYWDKEESQEFLQGMEGSFEGIGAEIGIRDQILTVVAPLDDMPAQKAGIKAGDKILKINDEITTELDLDEAVEKIKGPKGTKVKLTIFREENGDQDPFEVEVTRDTIDIKSVKWEDKGDGIAYVRVSGFLKDTEKEFSQAAAEIGRSGTEEIILDLRNNPGGFLGSAIDLAGYFLPRGSIVVREDYGEENKLQNKEHVSKGKGALKDYPLVILINKGTASSAEILAGAIRDNRGVKLVGEKTFGKGSVQEVESLEEGSSLKITVAKWLTPDGKDIDKEGISPDIEQKYEKSGSEEEGDNQLEKAIEILKAQ